MFTGLIEAVGKVQQLQSQPHGVRLTVHSPATFGDSKDQKTVAIGDSVAINGCCLTVVALGSQTAEFEAGEETLSRTNLGVLQEGSPANLERSLRVGDRLGGHFVTGHIDCLGTVHQRDDDADWCTMWFEIPADFASHLASKGSVAIDGVSLTVVDVVENRFSVALIPHTLEHTTLGNRSVGDQVNIETDVLAKYVQRALGSGISLPE